MSREIHLNSIFKALGDSRRRKILIFLKNTPMTTGYICQLFNDLDRCTVMKHLKVLEKAKLIKIKRTGRERWNYIDNTKICSKALPWLSQLQ